MHDYPRSRLCDLFVLAAALGAAALFDCPATASPADTQHPNIVFILADDLGINDLSCYGRKDQPTPKIDRLAEQGVRFTTAYAQSVC